MKTLKKIGKIAFWALSLLSILVITAWTSSVQHQRSVKELIVTSTNDLTYITKEEIIADVNNGSGTIIGDNLTDVNTHLIEERLKNNLLLEDAQVYKTIDGTIHIIITQRNPIMRIINQQNEIFYLDEKGKLMPTSDNYSARIVTANGNIRIKPNFASSYDIMKDSLNPIGKDLYQMASYINNNPFWKAQIAQIYITENNEMELVPKVGNHLIEFGKSNDMELKFNKLLLFYKKGLPNLGWNKYSKINLNYKNQVVCTKKQ